MPADRTIHVFDTPGVEAGAVKGVLAGRLSGRLVVLQLLQTDGALQFVAARLELELGQVLLEVVDVVVLLLVLGVPGGSEREGASPAEDGHQHRPEEGEQQQRHHRHCQVVRNVDGEGDALLHGHPQLQVRGLALDADDEPLALAVALRVEVELGEDHQRAVLLELAGEGRHEGSGGREVGLEAGLAPEVERQRLRLLLADAQRNADELVALDGSYVEVADAAAVELVGLQRGPQGSRGDVAGTDEALRAPAHPRLDVAARVLGTVRVGLAGLVDGAGGQEEGKQGGEDQQPGEHLLQLNLNKEVTEYARIGRNEVIPRRLLGLAAGKCNKRALISILAGIACHNMMLDPTEVVIA